MTALFERCESIHPARKGLLRILILVQVVYVTCAGWASSPPPPTFTPTPTPCSCVCCGQPDCYIPFDGWNTSYVYADYSFGDTGWSDYGCGKTDWNQNGLIIIDLFKAKDRLRGCRYCGI